MKDPAIAAMQSSLSGPMACGKAALRMMGSADAKRRSAARTAFQGRAWEANLSSISSAFLPADGPLATMTVRESTGSTEDREKVILHSPVVDAMAPTNSAAMPYALRPPRSPARNLSRACRTFVATRARKQAALRLPTSAFRVAKHRGHRRSSSSRPSICASDRHRKVYKRPLLIDPP